MNKRNSDEMSAPPQPSIKFPGVSDNPFDGSFLFRDNSFSLAELGKQVLFLRPTQLGKSSLLALAFELYDKRFQNNKTPPHVSFVPEDANQRFVFLVNFLGVSGVDAETVDKSLENVVEQAVADFLDSNKELRDYYKDPSANCSARDHVKALAKAVSEYGKGIGKNQSLLVLVDEYDKPARELLMEFIGKGDEAPWEALKSKLVNYRAFFTACKEITDVSFIRAGGLENVNIWVTGVLPVSLKLISDFNPENLTFSEQFADSIGYRDEDIDSMLESVDRSFPFKGDEKSRIRNAIRNLANQLCFASGSTLYHTRVVNNIMNVLLKTRARQLWLRNLSRLPFGTNFQVIPESVFDVIRQQDQDRIRRVARELSLDQEILSTLNEDLSLGDLLQKPMSDSSYLTLLVHLGVASVTLNDRGDAVFRATSTFFRIPFYKRLLENALQPLLDAPSLEELYKIGVQQVTEFVGLLPTSGMSSLIRWAEQQRNNHILELQFQGFLVGQLADSLWCDDVKRTQEDILGSGRTDVRIAGRSNVVLLELKQKATSMGPTRREMDQHHKQLSSYMADFVQEEKLGRVPRRVAGFVVVMYNNGRSFHVERTTFEHSK